ncbi:DUF6197 family protein [Streptomyces sp. MN13]
MAAPTRTRTAAPAELDLEARLALVGATMSIRLDEAAVAYEVRTAHIPSADPIPEITAPLPLTPTPAPSSYSTPIAALLHRARMRIATVGWCQSAAFDEAGAVCPIHAIRQEAASRGQADDACVLLLESIRQQFSDETIPAWNARQPGSAPVLLQLDRAAALADSRGL